MQALDPHSDALAHAAARAQLGALAMQTFPHTGKKTHVGSFLTDLMKHGGLYTLLDTPMLQQRLAPFVAQAQIMGGGAATAHTDMAPLMAAMQGQVTSFFSHLVDAPYMIPSSLMSHLSFPHEGTTYSREDQPSANVPAALTFLGQFIDHDLTMNAVNLFVDQTGTVKNDASPLIDLDCVYGPRSAGTSPSTIPSAMLELFHDDGTFKVADRSQGGVTVVDFQRLLNDPKKGSAFVADKRNDENQLVAQIHLLFMRYHNRLVRNHGMDRDQAYIENLFTFQSIILNDYVPHIMDTSVAADVLKAIKAKDFAKLKAVPTVDPVTHRFTVSMPHEFAIGFRFGHSQLRSSYKLRPGQSPVSLFDNSQPSNQVGGFHDLRGTQNLTAEHTVDWAFFLGSAPGGGVKSNLIDEKVTSTVFDLPESAIPDDIKYVGNLAHRNLIRSRLVGVCSGEALAKLYELPLLSETDIEPDASKHALYTQMVGANDVTARDKFKTPLWYYILREAALRTDQIGKLGKLGSHLHAEVILGGIYYNPPERVIRDDWKSVITGTNKVTLDDLAAFVTE